MKLYMVECFCPGGFSDMGHKFLVRDDEESIAKGIALANLGPGWIVHRAILIPDDQLGILWSGRS